MLSTLTLLSMASAATTPEPAGYIVTFATAACVSISDPTATGLLQDKDTPLPNNKCVNISPVFQGFRPAQTIPCPKGKKPYVSVFGLPNCGGQPTSSGDLPADKSPGQCQNVLVGTKAGELPSVGAQSALFNCA